MRELALSTAVRDLARTDSAKDSKRIALLTASGRVLGSAFRISKSKSPLSKAVVNERIPTYVKKLPDSVG